MCTWPRSCEKMHSFHPSGIGFDSFCSPSASVLLEGARISL